MNYLKTPLTFFAALFTTQHFGTVCCMILVLLPPHNFPACHVKNPVVINYDFGCPSLT